MWSALEMAGNSDGVSGPGVGLVETDVHGDIVGRGIAWKGVTVVCTCSVGVDAQEVSNKIIAIVERLR
jgi:hypothetical protein